MINKSQHSLQRHQFSRHAVNIVERLQKKYDANPSGLKAFVSELYDEAGSLLTFNKTEVDRSVANNAGGSRGRTQTIGVFLPECENQKDFRGSLAALFDAQKDPASDTKVAVGKLSNQIVIMKIASLMPARFVESLGLEFNPSIPPSRERSTCGGRS